jgi:hypothetical protein
MKYIRYTQVDSVTGVSIAKAPAANGPSHPAIPGLQFLWARESDYPTNSPEFFGTCPDDSDTDVEGVIGLYGATDFDSMHVAELSLRPKPSSIQDRIVHATQQRLDAFAKTRNYDSILSACTYATSSVPRFAGEGQAAVDARDATWDALYTLLGEVMAGTRPMPTGFEEVEPLLPELEWPT